MKALVAGVLHTDVQSTVSQDVWEVGSGVLQRQSFSVWGTSCSRAF
jgi:hypothetical protein